VYPEVSGPRLAKREHMARVGTRVLVVVTTTAVLAAVLWLAWQTSSPAEAPDETQASTPAAGSKLKKIKVSDEERTELLRHARVWRTPRTPVAHVSLAGELLDELSCRFKVSDLGGTTPKFDCDLDDGETIRIKYGKGPEVQSEAAATRLLKALGFLADDITLVRRLRCYGCPKEPFSVMKAVEITGTEPVYQRVVNFDSYEEFEWVALERKYPAPAIETDTLEGWAFFELDTIDPSRGGAPRAHVDALRLIAVLLAHWDNKAENQRMVCLAPGSANGEPCRQPYLMLQDVGASFGPMKVDLTAWESAPIWEDRATCAVSMRKLPFDGATFGQAYITEPGRLMVSGLLAQLTDDQLTDLFTYARFAERQGLFTAAHPVADWVRVFKDKLRAITEGPACPSE
jgi:hypothetical protein